MPYRNPNDKADRKRRVVSGRKAVYMKECAWCKSTEMLELHHVDPNTKVTHRVWDLSEDRIKDELAKCIVLCSSCHKAETARQRRSAMDHGTRTMYDVGCRCDDCRGANSRYRKERRSARLSLGTD